MKDIKVWAIRHKPTGRFLISGNGHSGRGSSYYEPMEVNATVQPRFFADPVHAKRCLDRWLMGRHIGDREDGYTYTAKIEKVSSRKREEMEIVPIIISFDVDRYYNF